ncbi:MAG: flippase [bacterium]
MVQYNTFTKAMPTLSTAYIKEKWQHAGFQKYLKNTSWMFFGRFFTLGISFFIGIYIARYLGPSNYGLLSYVTSFVGLFGFLASFGIDSIVSREIIKDHDKKDEIIGTGFYIKIIGSFVAIASVFIISYFTTKDLFTLGLIWLFSLNFIPQAFNILETYFQSQVLSKKVVTAQVVANIISTILKISVIILNKGIFWLILIYIVETSIYALILLFSFRKFGNHIRKWKFNISVAKSILKDSWPLMLSTVAVSIYMKIDQVMIKNMLGNEQAGIYAVAVKLSEVWYFIPTLICTSLSPSIIKALNMSKDLFEDRMKKLYFSLFWFAVAIASFVSVFSYFIIKILFGNAYIGAVPTLQIYVWAGVAVFMGVAVGQYLLASNLTRLSFYSTILGTLTNIIINIILIPRIGIKGAAISTLISYTIATFGIFFFKDTKEHCKLIFKSILNF